MTKAELLKLAEHGVRMRLAELQLEINKLAAEFPHIVNNMNGSVPAVAPLTAKGKPSKNTELSKLRKAYWAGLTPADREARLTKMLKARRKTNREKAKAAAK